MRNELRDNPSDTVLMQQYNIVDIKAEAELSTQIPDLSPTELEFWLADQAINRRGVRMDRKSIENCIRIVEQAYVKYNAEIPALTGGAVTAVTQLARITKWMNGYSVFSKSLDEAHIDELLKTLLPPEVHRVLQIRQLIGSAAVKKLYAMINRLSADGRMRDLFVYHTARTGRAGGEGVQPQNLPNNAWMKAWACGSCDKHSTASTCFWCGNTITKEVEWNTLAIENALAIIATRNLSCVEMYFGEAIATVSGCLRGMFISAEGHDFVSSDYSSIEGIVLAQLAGEQWHLDVYNTHGMMYEATASRITGTTLEEFKRFKQETGSHHADRKIGKVASLACFAPDTQVLTDRGYVGIKDVRQSDKLWDGVEWVNHEGVIYKGKRKVIVLDGVKMTPQHPISLGDSWKEARVLNSNANILSLALEIGSRNLPSLGFVKRQMTGGSSFNALAVPSSMKSIFQTYVKGKAHAVILALKRKLKKRGLNSIHAMTTSSQIQSIEEDCLTGFRQQIQDAIQKHHHSTQHMARGESQFLKNGEKTELNFLNMLLPLKIGMSQSLKWIASTLTGIMNQGISASSQRRITKIIKEKWEILKEKFGESSYVYDIAHAGSRNCFTIRVNSGHLIVHNSGYQGWLGAWIKFKADEFLTEEQIISSVRAWREASPMIVRMWKELELAAHMATMNKGMEFGYREIIYLRTGDVLYCRLPSGRYLSYHRPQISPNTKRPGTMQLTFEGWNSDATKGPIGWTRMSTYGGRLTENVVQAVARDILAHAIINLEKRGYPVVLHVHDEVVCEVPEGSGSVAELENIMTTLPEWAEGWPIKAAGGWRAKRYQK